MHTPAFEELRELALSERGDGLLTVEYDELSTREASPANAADAFVVRHGLKPIGKAWQIIQRQEALDLLRRILFRDVAYRHPQTEEKTAQFIAESFLDLFCPYQGCYCTNGCIDEHGMSLRSPITESTFELGVVHLTRSASACYGQKMKIDPRLHHALQRSQRERRGCNRTLRVAELGLFGKAGDWDQQRGCHGAGR